jgi:CubicO group peptidase (beta-lactamase class C family)
VVDHYGVGRHSSPRAFGHGGAYSSVAFCDPGYDLVAAYVCNGMPGDDRHHRRLDAVSSAIYVDLGIASADDPGRPKPYPVAGLRVASAPRALSGRRRARGADTGS